MSSVSLGDLSQSFLLQRRSVALRQDMSRLTDELSSGKVSDVRKVLAGNHSYLSDLERSLKTLDAYSVANAEISYFTGAMQASLNRVQDAAGGLGLDLILAGGGPVGVVAGSPSGNATTRLDTIVSSLNDDIAGRSLFAGTATDRPPLASGDVIKAAVLAAVSGQTSPEDILLAAQAWFDNPTGFDSIIYAGSADALAPFILSETEKVSLDVRANDAAIKETLMYTAVAAIADDPSLGLSVEQQSELFGLAGLGLQTNQDQITNLRSRIGFTEARIETIAARNQAEETATEFARNALLLADPFETATQLESVQFQLQGLYSVTVRSSQLSLVNFL